MYNNDCVFQCVAYMNNNMYPSNQISDQYALNFFSNTMFGGDPGSSTYYADSYLTQFGAGLDLNGMRNYVTYLTNTGMNGGNAVGGEAYIAYFNTDDMPGYSSTGTYHAVVIEYTDYNGTVHGYDPQNKSKVKFTSAEAAELKYLLY